LVLLGPFIVLLSCSKDRPAPAAPAGKSLASLAAPAVPTNLRFDAPTDSSCTVRWDASDGATDYDVNYKPAVGGRWTNEPHRGTGLSNTIRDLQPNTEYRWAVRAENSDGTSAWVFGPNFTTLADSVAPSAGAPAPPTNLRIDQLTATSVRVRWDASDGATDYDVNYKAVGGRWTNEPHRDTQLYNTIEGLEPNTEYQWAVRAENSAGTSTWVHADNFTTLSDSTSSSDSSSASSGSDSSPSDGIFIPDTALRTFIEKELNKNPGETITQEEMNTLEFLALGGRLEVKNLRGLETATNLQILTIGSVKSQVSDLTPLANLNKLHTLYVFANQVSDLTPLANLNELRFLNFSANQVSDLTPLANLNELDYLDLNGNQIFDLTPLTNLTGLRELVLSNNQVSDLTPLANLNELRRLELAANQVSDLTPLANLNELRRLELAVNQVSDLTLLTNLSNLREIDFAWNNVSDLSPLTALSDLEKLNAWGNPLSETSINEHIPAFQSRGVVVSFSSSRSFTEGPFSIDFVFLDDFTEKEQEIWHHIAKRWEAAIQTELSDYEFSNVWSRACGEHSIEIPAGEQIDDLRIYVTKFPLGSFGGWGYAAPMLLRSNSLPIIGCVGINQGIHSFDLLWDTGVHEIGHVLGIGTIWHGRGMIRDLNADTHFVGPQAIAAFNQAGGTDYQGAKVPTEQDGGHWRFSVLSGELMASGKALSAITLQALSDLGYSVDLSAADSYVLPSPRVAKPADEVPFCSLEGLTPPVYVVDD